MNKKDQMLSQQNRIDNLIRQSFGYSDEQLVTEFNEAEKGQENSSSYQVPTYEFKLIMSRLEKDRAVNKMICLKTMVKVSVLVAAIAIAFSAFGIAVIGNRYYKYIPGVKIKNEKQIVWDNTKGNYKSVLQKRRHMRK